MTIPNVTPGTVISSSAWGNEVASALNSFGVFDTTGSVPNASSTVLSIEAITDPNSWLASAEIVPDVAGWYDVALSCVWPNTASNRFLVALRKNGSDLPAGVSNVAGPVAGNPCCAVTTAVYLNGSSDAISARFLQSVGSGQTPTVTIVVKLLEAA